MTNKPEWEERFERQYQGSPDGWKIYKTITPSMVKGFISQELQLQKEQLLQRIEELPTINTSNPLAVKTRTEWIIEKYKELGKKEYKQQVLELLRKME